MYSQLLIANGYAGHMSPLLPWTFLSLNIPQKKEMEVNFLITFKLFLKFNLFEKKMPSIQF